MKRRISQCGPYHVAFPITVFLCSQPSEAPNTGKFLFRFVQLSCLIGRLSSKINKSVTRVTGDAYRKALFSYIIRYTKDYAVGPLDYCGIARIIHGRYVLSCLVILCFSSYLCIHHSHFFSILVCRNDPQERAYINERLEMSIARRGRIQPGTRKGPADATKKKKVKRKIRGKENRAPLAYPIPGSDQTDAVEEDEIVLERPAKKRRISMDQKIALGLV